MCSKRNPLNLCDPVSPGVCPIEAQHSQAELVSCLNYSLRIEQENSYVSLYANIINMYEAGIKYNQEIRLVATFLRPRRDGLGLTDTRNAI